MILALICLLGCAHAQSPTVSLLLPGAYHAGEVKAANGEQWVGLFQTPGGFAWRPATLKLRRVVDPLLDEDGRKTGIEVAVRQGEPILLLKGLKGLSATKVHSLRYSQSGLDFPPGEALEFVLPGAAPYKLHVTNRREYDDSPRTPSRLLLESNGQKQTLYEWPQGLLDERCKLIWAGDLDGDGKLDLLMTLSDHYNADEYTLFLSSKRTSGSLVQRVAAFRIVGC